jgi:hypothetical protein
MGYERETGPAIPTPGRRRADPTIEQVLNGEVSRADVLSHHFAVNSKRVRVMSAEIREQAWRELRSEDDGHLDTRDASRGALDEPAKTLPDAEAEAPQSKVPETETGNSSTATP